MFCMRKTAAVARFDPRGRGSADSRSPGGSEYGIYEFARVFRCGVSVGSLTDFGGVGRVGQCRGHSMFGVPTCGSGSAIVGWSDEAGQYDCL